MASVVLNKKLSSLYRHQDCQIRDKCLEASRLQEEVLILRVQVSSQSAGDLELQTLRSTIEKLNSKIANLEDHALKQDEEMAEQAEHNRTTVSNLQAAHKLISKHLDSANEFLVETNRLTKECTLLTSQCDTLKNQLSTAETNLVDLTMSMKDASEVWHQKETKLKEVITAKDQHLQTLEESKAQLKQVMSEMSERNEKLAQQLEQAQSKLAVTRSDIGVLVGSSFLCVSDRSVQASLDLNTATTQTPRPDTTNDTSQTNDEKRLSCLIQTDACDTSSTASQTVQFLVFSNGSSQASVGRTPSLQQDFSNHCMSSKVIIKPLKICQESWSSFYHENHDMSQIKIETTEHSNDEPSTFVAKDKQNVNDSECVKEGKINRDKKREIDNSTASQEHSKWSRNIHDTSGCNNVTEHDLTAECEETLPSLCSEDMDGSSTLDCSTNSSTNITKTSIVVSMKHELADYSMQENFSRIYSDADSDSNLSSHAPCPNVQDIQNSCESFSKISFPMSSFDPRDFLVTSHENCGLHIHECNNTQGNIIKSSYLRTTTGVKSLDPSCVNKVLLSVSQAEHRMKVSTRLDLMSAPQLTSPQSEVSDVNSVFTFDGSCSLINEQDGTSVTNSSKEQSLLDMESNLKVCNTVQSSEVTTVCGGRVQRSESNIICEGTSQTDDSCVEKVLNSGASVICEDEDQSLEISSICGQKAQSSDTIISCTDKVIYNKTNLHIDNCQTSSSSDISKPVFCLCTEDTPHTQLDRRFPKEIIFPDQNLPDLHLQCCTDLDGNKKSLIFPSHGSANNPSYMKKVTRSLKLAKPGRASRNLNLISPSSMLTPNLSLKRLSSNTITRSDLEEDSPVDSSSLLKMQSSTTSSKSEHPSVVYQFLNCSSKLHQDQSQAGMHSNSTNISPALQQMSFTNQILWETDCAKLETSNKSPLNKSTSSCFSNPTFYDKNVKKPKMSPTFLSKDLSSVTKQQGKLFQLRLPGDRQSERTSRSKPRDKNKYQMLFVVPREKEPTHSVTSCEKSTLLARVVTPKGILKAPQTDRTKSVTQKSVSFLPELEHHLHSQDNGKPKTSAQSSSASQVNSEVSYSDLQFSGITDGPVTSINLLNTFHSETSSSTHLKDDKRWSPQGSSLTEPCLIVPETPNLELSDSEYENTSRTASAETSSSESPVAVMSCQRSKHSCQDVTSQVSTVEDGSSAVKKHKTC